MPNPNPATGGEQPASDADFRHTPSPNPPGNVATDTKPPASGKPTSAKDWADPGSSEVIKGQRTAGGVDGAHPHMFHLTEAAASVFPGGGLQGGHGENWPMLKGQAAAFYLARLEPGGVREPHWHPSAWEINFVVQGRVKWTFVGPEATQDTFEGSKGDVIFAPQGHFHYFENASDTEDLVVFIVFNSSSTEPGDDIGLVHAMSAMPKDVLAACFGGTPDLFEKLPGKLGRVVIASKTAKR